MRDIDHTIELIFVVAPATFLTEDHTALSAVEIEAIVIDAFHNAQMRDYEIIVDAMLMQSYELAPLTCIASDCESITFTGYTQLIVMRSLPKELQDMFYDYMGNTYYFLDVIIDSLMQDGDALATEQQIRLYVSGLVAHERRHAVQDLAMIIDSGKQQPNPTNPNEADAYNYQNLVLSLRMRELQQTSVCQ